jgi:alanyl-tRNA synthetase
MTEQKGLKRELRKVGERVLQHEAREMVREIDEPVIVKLFEEGSAQEVRQLALAVIRNSGFVTLFGLRSGDKAHLIMARSEDLALDLRDLIPVVSPLLDAKGGGRPSLVELVGKNPAALDAALDRARGAIKL